MKIREKFLTVAIAVFVVYALIYSNDDWSSSNVVMEKSLNQLGIAADVVVYDFGMDDVAMKNITAVLAPVIDPAKKKWEMTQEIRKEALRQACGSRDPSTELDNIVKNKGKLWHMLVDDNHKVFYCYVPKVGCTNWKRLMLIMAGIVNTTNPLEIKHGFTHVAFGKLIVTNRKYHAMTDDELKERLRTYKKFMVARHPLEKVLSAYRDKIENSKTRNPFYWKISHQMAIVIRKQPDLKLEDFKGLSFQEFVQYIVTQKSNDEHFKSHEDLCFPCSMNFDYIAKYETINEDSAQILDAIGAPEYLKFPDEGVSSTTAKLESYLKELEPDLLLQLYKKYKTDFEMFGYHL